MCIVGLQMSQKTILEHYLYCPKVLGLCAAAQTTFAKFQPLIEERGLDWMKCKSVTTDGEASMQGSTNRVVRNIKIVSLDCVSTHCSSRNICVKRLMEENNQRQVWRLFLMMS